MDAIDIGSTNYRLPGEIQEFCEVTRRFVRDELLPLKRDFMASPNQAYGLPEVANMHNAFQKEVTDRLERISRDTGFWFLRVSEEHGGAGLSMLLLCPKNAFAPLALHSALVATTAMNAPTPVAPPSRASSALALYSLCPLPIPGDMMRRHSREIPGDRPCAASY